MTKIYLVYMKGISVEGNFTKTVWAVFTNKRKAQVYCEYKNEVTDGYWLEDYHMKKVEWIVETRNIWTEDFTFKLNQIQSSNLPF